MKTETLCAHVAQILLTVAAVAMFVLVELRSPSEHPIYLSHTVFFKIGR